MLLAALHAVSLSSAETPRRTPLACASRPPADVVVRVDPRTGGDMSGFAAARYVSCPAGAVLFPPPSVRVDFRAYYGFADSDPLPGIWVACLETCPCAAGSSSATVPCLNSAALLQKLSFLSGAASDVSKQLASAHFQKTRVANLALTMALAGVYEQKVPLCPAATCLSPSGVVQRAGADRAACEAGGDVWSQGCTTSNTTTVVHGGTWQVSDD